ncbi:MAG: glycosyltransferase [Nitrososphaerota archaeon]|nr:glycosyltransferase [Candidatus Bathyarchaeota archaeon]MDW8023122.1 glycosyltransferase [Nitrososphaerota archaeon]
METEKEEHPDISIIVPVRNGAAKIKDLLDSLMQVDYDKDKLEIIVVDGNSTDATREIVSQYPIKLTLEEKNGVNAARNTGIKKSSGEIIAFTDHDCVVSENWVKEIMKYFQDPSVGCVGGKVLRYDDDLLSLYADESLVPVMRIFKKEMVISKINSPFTYPVGCNFAVKREAFEKAGLFDERFKYGFDELEFAERICNRGYKLVLTPNITVQHKHRSTLSELLRQTFRYGEGGGLLFKIKGFKSVFTKWILLSIFGFLLWLFAVLCTAVYAVFGEFLSVPALFALLLIPPVVLMLIYTYRTFKMDDGFYKRIVIYPFLDIARFVAFVAGGIYYLVRPTKGKTKTEKTSDHAGWDGKV